MLNNACAGLYTVIASATKNSVRMPSYSRCVARAISAMIAILPARSAAICAPASSTNTSIAIMDAEKLMVVDVFLNTLRTPSAIKVILCPDSTMMCISPVALNASISSAGNVPRNPSNNPPNNVASFDGRKVCIFFTKRVRICSKIACSFRFPVHPLSCMYEIADTPFCCRYLLYANTLPAFVKKSFASFILALNDTSSPLTH